MADNTKLPLGTLDGDTYASDDISSVKFQRVKLTLGADGVNDGDVASGNPIPVTGTVTVGSAPTTAVTQSGTWTVQPGNTANTTAWKVDASSVAVPVTDNSGSLTVDGTVAVSAIAGALPAGSAVIGHVIADSGSTTAVTGNVTVVQGTATNLKVDASGVAVPVTDNSGSLTVDNAGTFAVQASIAAAQTLATVTTVGTVTTITNVVHVDDNSGSLTVDGTVGTNEVPDATSTYAPTNATSTALEASRVIKASAGVLFSLTGYNSKSSSQYIQLHNTASLPADTAVPVMIIRVAAQQNFSLDFGGKFGRFFSTGITICNSSTPDTKTIGSADCFFDAQYK